MSGFLLVDGEPVDAALLSVTQDGDALDMEFLAPGPFSASVEVALTPAMTEPVALLAGLDVADVSMHLDTHLERGTE